MANVTKTRAAKKQKTKMLEECVRNTTARPVSSTSTLEEITVKALDVRVELVVDEKDGERLMLAVKSLRKWFETPEGKAVLARGD